jgi:uncharacterized membrane protein YfcA
MASDRQVGIVAVPLNPPPVSVALRELGPTLTWLGLTQLHAEATSLLAILPTAAAGVWRQRSYGNVRWRAALILGVAAIAGVEGGVQIAEALPEHALRKLFGVLMLAVATRIAVPAWRKAAYPS